MIIKGQMDKVLARARKLHRVYRGIGTQREFTSLEEFEEFLREKRLVWYKNQSKYSTPLLEFILSIVYYQRPMIFPMYDVNDWWEDGYQKILLERCEEIVSHGFPKPLVDAVVEPWQTGREEEMGSTNLYEMGGVRGVQVGPEDPTVILLYSNPQTETCRTRMEGGLTILNSNTSVWCVPHPLWSWVHNNPGECRLDIKCTMEDVLRVQESNADMMVYAQTFTVQNTNEKQAMLFVVLKNTVSFIVRQTHEVRAILLNLGESGVFQRDLHYANRNMQCIECNTFSAGTAADFMATSGDVDDL